MRHSPAVPSTLVSESDLPEPMTYREFLGWLQRVDIPNEATVVVERWDDGSQEMVEVPVIELTASIGHGRPSKLIIHSD